MDIKIEVYVEGCWLPTSAYSLKKDEMFRVSANDRHLPGLDRNIKVFKMLQDAYTVNNKLVLHTDYSLSDLTKLLVGRYG